MVIGFLELLLELRYDLMPNFDTSYYHSPYTQAHGTAVASVIAANKENIFFNETSLII